MSEIDLDEFQKFLDKHPLHRSPEDLLDDVVEGDDLRLAVEATHILSRWDRMAAIGEPISPEVKRFEAEAFFTRHLFAGAEGIPAVTR